jgi:hypothetical protein
MMATLEERAVKAHERTAKAQERIADALEFIGRLLADVAPVRGRQAARYLDVLATVTNGDA